MSGNADRIHKQLWELDQDLHVKIQGLENETQYSKQTLIDYIKQNIEPLNLRLNLIFDDVVDHTSKGGITFTFHRHLSGDSFGTRKITGFRQELLGTKLVLYPYTVMSTKIDLRVMDQFLGPNNPNAFKNICFHEFLHGLGVAHIDFLPKKMSTPLMREDGLSTDKLYYNYNDKRAARSLYAHHGEKLVFKPEEVNKTCCIIQKKNKNKKKSFCFKITNQVMWVIDLPQRYKKEII